MLIHDVIVTSSCCQQYAFRMSAGNDFVPAGQCTGTPRCARATVELLRQETPNFLGSKLWPPNNPDLSPVDHEIWAVMQHLVYSRKIHSVEWPLIYVWCGLNSRLLTRLLTIGEEDIKHVRSKWVHFEYRCEVTMLILSISVTFHMTYLTVASLITKSCQERSTLANTFSFILADLR